MAVNVGKTVLGIGVGLLGATVVWTGGFVAGRASVSPPPTATVQPSAPAISPAPEPPPAPAMSPEDQLALTCVTEALRLRSLGAAEFEAELAEWSATASEVSYAQLERSAEAHRGERAVFSGRVAQIQDTAEGTSVLRLATRGRDGDVLWVEGMAPDQGITAGSRVRVYGYLAGTRSYQSQAGWNISLPQLLAVAIVER